MIDGMTLNQYQTAARQTAIYPKIGTRFVYPALGLCGESGEIAEKVKKIFRDYNGILTEDYQEQLKFEIGDVLWYVANFALDIGLTLNEVAEANITKLADREQRGQINGSGDKR